MNDSVKSLNLKRISINKYWVLATHNKNPKENRNILDKLRIKNIFTLQKRNFV